MNKLQTFENKRTAQIGLWWHPEMGCFTSPTISLKQLRDYKGMVQLYLRKNRYYNNGENGRPNYIIVICDSKMSEGKEVEVEECESSETKFVFTEGQLESFLNHVVADCQGVSYGDVLTEDYNLSNWCEVING